MSAPTMASEPVKTGEGARVAGQSVFGATMSQSTRLPALLVAASSSSLGTDRPSSPPTLSRPVAPLEHGFRPHDRNNGTDSAVLLPALMPPSGGLGSMSVNPGWCSARMCNYPQWLVFSLSQGESAPCSVSTVQVLAHNFKIPSKISILIPSSPPSSTSPSLAAAELDRISWVEYGHLVLSPNTASNYRAREHLTVPTDIQNVSFIKLVLHSPHHNPLNLWRQVSLLEVRFHGAVTACLVPSQPRARSPTRQSTMIPPSNSHPLVSIAYAALEVLADQKQQAVACENYSRAAEIKSQTDHMLDLVRQLQQCAQVPNDGSAGAEMWVRRLSNVESQLRAALGKVGTAGAANAHASPDHLLFQSSTMVQVAEPGSLPAPSVFAADDSFTASSLAPVAGHSVPTLVVRAQSPTFAPAHADVKLPITESNLPRLPSPAPTRTKSPPVPAVANRSRAESANTSTILSSPNQTFATDRISRSSPVKEPLSTRLPTAAETSLLRSKSRSMSRSPAATPIASPTPPPVEPDLSETQQVDYRLAIDWLGAPLVARFLAKDFATRDQAVQDILAHLDPAAWPADDPSVVVKGAFTLIDPSLSDPRERVTGWALAMWSALVAAMGGAGAGSGAASMFTSLSSLHWAALIGRAADTNARVAGPARQLAVALVTGWPATFVPLVLRGFPGTGPWRSAWARVILVDDTVEKVGIVGVSGGLGVSLGGISPALGEVAGGKQGLKKKPSVAARLGTVGRSSSANMRPSTPSKVAGTSAAAAANAGSSGAYELAAVQEFLSRALSHTHAQVRDAAANLLVSVAKLVGAPAVWPVVDGLEQRSQVQTLRAKIEKYAPAPAHVHSTQSPVRNQQQQQAHQQMEQQPHQFSPSPPRHARHQSTTHVPVARGHNESQPHVTVAPRPSSVQGMQAVRTQQPSSVQQKAQQSPRKPQLPAAQMAQPTAPVSSLPQPTARPPSTLSLSDRKDTGKKDKEKKGFWDRLFNHSASGHSAKDGKKDKRSSTTSGTKPVGVSFATDHDPMGLLGSPPPHDTSFVSSSGAAAHAQDRTLDLGNSTIMSTASVPGGPAGGQANETEGDWNLDFTCVFCEEVNPDFVQQRLDEHYWRECPCLCACAYCAEVVEVANMHTHLKLECKSPQAKTVQLPADTCVMCRAKIGVGEAAFRKHLLVGDGCIKAVRKPKLGVKYRV